MDKFIFNNNYIVNIYFFILFVLTLLLMYDDDDEMSLYFHLMSKNKIPMDDIKICTK